MNQFTSVLAAKIGSSQAKALIRVDDLGDVVDAKVIKVWRKILRLIHADPMPRDFLHQLYDLLSSVVGTAQAALSTGLVKQAQQVHEDVTAEVFSQLPPGHKIMLAQMASPPQLTEAKATPEQAEQMKSMIFPPQTEAAARSIVHRSTAGVGWEARLAQQTTLAPPGQLASLITTWRATGTTPKIMEEAMMPLVNGVRSTARRVARTEGQRVASQTRLESYEALGDLVIGYQIHATMDSHTRPHHAARNGQTYFKNPSAGQLSSTDMPIPPQESDGSVAHNCRCWITPIVDVQPQIEDDPAAKKLFTDAEANLVPDPASYADWFATASPGERRKAAGSRRLSAAQDRLPPDQTVSWIDVLKLNGELLTAEELTRESEEARLARVKAVGDLIDRRRELARKIAQFGYLPPELGGTRAAVPVPVPPVEPVLVEPGKLTLADLPAMKQPTPGDLNPHFPATILPVVGMDLLRLKTLQLAADEAKRVGAVGMAADGLPMEHTPAHLLGGITAKVYDVSSVAKDLLFERHPDGDFRQSVNMGELFGLDALMRIKTIYAATVATNPGQTEWATMQAAKNSEATQKLRAKANPYLIRPPMPTLKALQKKYGAKNLAAILKVNAKQLEEYEMLAAHVPDDLNAIRGGRRWKGIMEERQATLEIAHQNIATAAAVLETLEEDADLARPIPRWACVAFPDIAKKSIRKLAEPFRARFDSMKAVADEEPEPKPEPVIRQPKPQKSDYDDVALWMSARARWLYKDDALNAAEREARKRAFDKWKAQESELKQKIHRESPGQSVGMQAIMTRRDGAPIVYSDQYLQKKKKADEFIGQVSGIAVPDLLFSDNANDLRETYAKNYARAFCASTGIYQGDNSSWQSLGIKRPGMFLQEKDNIGTWVHETGHAIEQADPYVEGMVQTFLNMRVGDEKPQEMKDLFPGHGFDPGEMGRKNHFDRAFYFQKTYAYYVGKDYAHGTTEVLSMGIQKLHDNPLEFMKKDPEYFEFVVSVLQYQDAKAAAAPEPPPAIAKKTRKKKGDL